jgi:hypothetical protein
MFSVRCTPNLYIEIQSTSRFPVVFLGPRANAELVPKFHVALHASHASHAALPVVALNITPCTDVTLTLGWIALFMGGEGEGAYTEKTKK